MIAPAPPQQKFPRYPTRTQVELFVARDKAPEALWTYDLSLSGAFLETRQPRTPGLRVGMRLMTPDTTVGIIARVVYVLDDDSAVRKARTPGMGVEFDSLDETARSTLTRFVDGLARANELAQTTLRPVVARFDTPTSVVVELEGRDALERIWHRELKTRGLFVPTERAPAQGARVTVALRTPDGLLSLQGEVVHVLAPADAKHLKQAAGAGIAITDLHGAKREALERYLAGTASTLGLQVPGTSGARYALPEVLLAVRRLFTGIDNADPFTACGLPRNASLGDVKGRISLLGRMFAAAPADATPPQAARIAAAARALPRVDATIQSVLAKEGEIVARTATPVRSIDDQRRELLASADQEQREGNLVFARRALQAVLQLYPHDTQVKRRIELIQARLDATRADELLENAEVFVRQSGMKTEAGTRAREALQLVPTSRPVQLRVLRILLRLDAANEVVALARKVVEEDPTQTIAWEALLLVYERRGHHALAARAAQEIVRLRPQDKEMIARAKKLKALVR